VKLFPYLKGGGCRYRRWHWGRSCWIDIKSWAIILAIVPTVALAQTPAAPDLPPPSDLQVEHDRSEMLQAQLQYFIDVMKRTEAEDKATKAWWSSFVAGLKPQ
jgi:hypothetical protein